MRKTKALGTIALVTLALALAIILPIAANVGSTTASSVGASTSTTASSTSTASTTTTRVITSMRTTTSTDSQYGLQLRVSISASQVYPGGTIWVNVTEFNTLSSLNEVNASGQWQIQGALSSCPNTNVQPFGIAVYKGHYTAQNVSQGTQLQIFPITPCPMYIRLVTGYLFQPNSDMATVLPGSGSTPMTASVDINGTYTGMGQALPPGGAYTVVASDEWGALAFLYFQTTGVPLPVQSQAVA